MFGRLLRWYTIDRLPGPVAPYGIFPGAKFTLRPSLRSPILSALLHATPAAGVSQTLRRGTRNGITELSQRAPLIFGRAAITFGIGPHFFPRLISAVADWMSAILPHMCEFRMQV